MRGIDVPLLSPRSTDEYAPVPPGPRQRRAYHRTVERAGDHAHRLDLTPPEYLRDRVGTAAALRALDAEHGGGFFAIPPEAALDPAAAEECFAALGPVIDVQTHLVRPSRITSDSAKAHGYPELTPTLKQKVLGGNASVLYGVELYGVDVPASSAVPDWLRMVRRPLASRLA